MLFAAHYDVHTSSHARVSRTYKLHKKQTRRTPLRFFGIAVNVSAVNVSIKKDLHALRRLLKRSCSLGLPPLPHRRPHRLQLLAWSLPPLPRRRPHRLRPLACRHLIELDHQRRLAALRDAGCDLDHDELDLDHDELDRAALLHHRRDRALLRHLEAPLEHDRAARL